MAEKAIHEMISAFAAGCIDRDNFINFKDYIDNGGELPYRELGEMQNLMALIPLILEREKPDPKLKEILANKLMGMQNEIKAKITKDKVTPKNAKVDILLPTEKFYKSRVSKDELTETYEQNLKNLPKVYEKKLHSDTKPDIRPPHQRKSNRNRSLSKFALWMGLGVVVILLLGAAYYFYDLNKSLMDNAAELREEIKLLQDEISSNREFLDNYGNIIEFFRYNDIAVIDLSPAEDDTDAIGKLFIAYGQLKGLLELKKLPLLSPDETYQLWIVSRGVSYSLGVFSPTNDVDYFPITQIPYFSIRDLELVRLTLEPAEGSSSPRGQTKLFGVISGNNFRRRR